jgi:uroporphyrinogen decarboxylase
MLPRDRVLTTLDFRQPDRIPVEVHSSPGGLFEHGQKLLDLIHKCPCDFYDLGDLTLPQALPEDFDADGSYHRVTTDAWGVSWAYRIFGVWGHPYNEPLADIGNLDTYKPPLPPPLSGPEFDEARTAVERHRQKYFCVGNGGMIWEQMHFLRPYEDCLMDIMDDTPEINRVADMITEYAEGCIRHHLATGVDAIQFFDDFGTQRAPIFRPALWRRFFKPRYERLCAPIRSAGKKILFHSCGQIMPLLEDLAALGVDAIWPQLPLFDPLDLVRRCRSLGLAVKLHPDRGELMQHGTPQEVRDYVLRLLDVFDTASGGSWLYLEIDPGFKWENIQALFECAISLGGSSNLVPVDEGAA